MANDLNCVFIVGRLTRDMTLIHQRRNGYRFSIAVNRRAKKGDGWADEASFFDCTAGKRLKTS